MNVVVTGATGFVGRHLVAALLARGHRVTPVARHRPPAGSLPWLESVDFVTCDLHADSEPEAVLGVPDLLVHLAWPGLPNYKDLFHIDHNLPADYRFIERMVAAGTRQVLVTGTCFEYGMQSGALSETDPALPTNPYGVAKNSLRMHLEMLRTRQPFALRWARLFYLHGPGQNPRSVLAQLDHSIDSGADVFDMSGGEQLRDYLRVERACERLAAIGERLDFSGIVNCCSGQPISVRRLVEEHIAARGADIRLNLGHYPYPDYEPFAFWGCPKRLDSLIGPLS